jgi:hypothetical protein
MLSENTRTELELSQSEQFFGLFIKNIRNGNENKVRLLWERQSQNWSICVKKTWVTENLHDCPKICVKKWRISRQRNRCIVLYLWPNPFWDSKPELFSDIACLRIPYQPCIVLFEKKNPGTPTSNRRELHLHLNVVPTGASVFKSRHILLHKYVNRIMITYLWCQIQLIRSFPAAASDPLNVAILTCFESMSRDRFFHELRGIIYSIHLIYRYWGILFFLHEELLLLILVVYIFRLISIPLHLQRKFST